MSDLFDYYNIEEIFPELKTLQGDERWEKMVQLRKKAEHMQKAVEWLSDGVNGDARTTALIFKMCMMRQHRTLQQSLNRMLLVWLEHVSSAEFEKNHTDGRNESSHKVCRELVENFVNTHGSNPSEWLPLI